LLTKLLWTLKWESKTRNIHIIFRIWLESSI